MRVTSTNGYGWSATWEDVCLPAEGLAAVREAKFREDSIISDNGEIVRHHRRRKELLTVPGLQWQEAGSVMYAIVTKRSMTRLA